MVASAVLVIISLFYIYTVASFVEANTYPLNGRITLVTSFNVHIINNHIDHVIIASGTLLWLVLSTRGKTKLIAPSIFAGLLLLAVSTGNQVLLQIVALISIPIVFSFFVYDSLSSRKIINMNLRILINYFAVMAIVLGIIGIVTISHYIFSVPHQNLMFIRNYAFDLFILLSSFSSILIFLLVACFPVKVIMKKIQTRIWKGIDNSINLVEINSLNAKKRITYLLLFMSLSIVLALIPHMPIINPDNQQVGVDTVYYVAWITPLMRSDNIQEILWQAFVVQNEGDRPLSLLLLYTAMELAKVNPFLISEYSPVILGPALVLAVYFLTRELTSYNDKISLLSCVSNRVIISHVNWSVCRILRKLACINCRLFVLCLSFQISKETMQKKSDLVFNNNGNFIVYTRLHLGYIYNSHGYFSFSYAYFALLSEKDYNSCFSGYLIHHCN